MDIQITPGGSGGTDVHTYPSVPLPTTPWGSLDPCPSLTTTPSTSVAPSLLPQKNFMVHFHQEANTVINKLDDYFKLLPENFETCNPIHWWVGQHAQFPDLFWLACDILCIPGVSIIC